MSQKSKPYNHISNLNSTPTRWREKKKIDCLGIVVCLGFGLRLGFGHENEFLCSGRSINEWKKRSRCKWIGRTKMGINLCMYKNGGVGLKKKERKKEKERRRRTKKKKKRWSGSEEERKKKEKMTLVM